MTWTQQEGIAGGRRAPWWVVALLAVAGAPASAGAQIDTSLTGTYDFAGGQEERTAHTVALDKAAAIVGAGTRPFVRAFLRKYLAIPKTIVFTPRGKQLAIAVDPFPERVGPLDGTKTFYRNTLGQRVALRRVVEGDTIVEWTDNGRNQRCLRFTFGAGLAKLSIAASFMSPAHLKAPIRYGLSYARR